jgi:hypothetical protein
MRPSGHQTAAATCIGFLSRRQSNVSRSSGIAASRCSLPDVEVGELAKATFEHLDPSRRSRTRRPHCVEMQPHRCARAKEPRLRGWHREAEPLGRFLQRQAGYGAQSVYLS